MGNAQDEAAKEGEERKAFDEATIDNAEFDKTKAQEREAKGIEEQSENLRKQMTAAKTADEMMEIAMKLKEVEGKRVVIGGESKDISNAADESVRLAEDIKKQASTDAEQAALLVQKIKNGNLDTGIIETTVISSTESASI